MYSTKKMVNPRGKMSIKKKMAQHSNNHWADKLTCAKGIFGNDPLADYQESQQPPATHLFPGRTTSKQKKGSNMI